MSKKDDERLRALQKQMTYVAIPMTKEDREKWERRNHVPKEGGTLLLSKNMALAGWAAINSRKEQPWVNGNAFVVGGNTKQKERLLLANLKYTDGSFVINDPDGTLYLNSKDDLTTRGYDIIVFDAETDTYNPFRYIYNRDGSINDWDMAVCAYLLVTGGKEANTHPEMLRTKRHTVECPEALVLQEALLHLAGLHPCKKPTWAEVCELLIRVVKGELLLTPQTDRWKNVDDAVLQRAVLCAAKSLLPKISYVSPMNHKTAKELHFGRLQKSKLAIFVHYDPDKTNPLVPLILYQAMTRAIARAELRAAEHEPLGRVTFLYGNTDAAGMIPTLENLLVPIEPWNMAIIIAPDTTKHMTPASYERIVENCDSIIALKPQTQWQAEEANRIIEEKLFRNNPHVAAEANVLQYQEMPLCASIVWSKGNKPYLAEAF